MRLFIILAICRYLDKSLNILYLAASVSPKLTLKDHKRMKLTLNKENNSRIIFPDQKNIRAKVSFMIIVPVYICLKITNI